MFHVKQPLDAPLAAAFPGGVYAVGGRVRDEEMEAVLGRELEYKDSDYVVVGLPLEEVRRRLEAIGEVDLVGASFAVFKVRAQGQMVDVALARRERSTGTGHRDFVVESGPDVTLEEDLGRRDFRMNMLARALDDGSLIDPYGGEADIRSRRIDIVAERCFVEDPLRMLRGAQFAARFGFSLTPRTLAAMHAAAPLVREVSPERVADELTKLLTRAAMPSVGFELLRETEVLAHIWPELAEGYGVEQNEWHAYDVWRHNLATLDAAHNDLTDRLAALLHDVGKPRTKTGPTFYRHEVVGEGLAREMLVRLRFPGHVVDDVAALVRHHMYQTGPELTPAAIRRFVRRVGPERLDRLFALRVADIVGSGLPKRGDHNERFAQRVRAVLAERPPLGVEDLAIGGHEMIALLIRCGRAAEGYRGGPEVGALLRYLLEQVLEEPARNTPAVLLGLAERALESAAPFGHSSLHGASAHQSMS
ncbi:HD domain-containing protein [bacterium]|nr:MAG: HD domain-containing protein [bacterium]